MKVKIGITGVDKNLAIKNKLRKINLPQDPEETNFIMFPLISVELAKRDDENKNNKDPYYKKFQIFGD